MTVVVPPLAASAIVDADGLLDCPYKGLMPYTEHDAAYFFGRDADRDLVVANLMASRLTVLYGPSGVGKSSLLRAGVIRDLRETSADTSAQFGLRPVVAAYHASWRDNPLVGLATALRAALPDQHAAELVPAHTALSVALLRDVTRRLDADVVLVCDQFEGCSTRPERPETPSPPSWGASSPPATCGWPCSSASATTRSPASTASRPTSRTCSTTSCASTTSTSPRRERQSSSPCGATTPRLLRSATSLSSRSSSRSCWGSCGPDAFRSSRL